MQIIDISHLVHAGMAVYPGDPEVRLEAWSRRAAGDEFDVSVLHAGTHTGTHVDAPAHCIDGGATIDRVPLDSLCGQAYVLDLSQDPGSAWDGLRRELQRVPDGCKRLLLRTGTIAWSGVSEIEAALLVERGLRLVGIDRPSIATPEAELAVHQALLRAGVIIVEGLALEAVAEGRYHLYCLPLRIAAADGAPARAILVEL